MYVDEAQDAYDLACENEQQAENAYYVAEQRYEEAQKAVREAEQNLKRGEKILSRFNVIEANYRADYSLLYSPGAESLMRYVAKNDVKEAIVYLNKIIDTVSSYCGVDMFLGGTSISRTSDAHAEYFDPGERERERRRTKAMEDAADRMRRELPKNRPNPDTIVRCKVCGRPMAICRCKPSIQYDFDIKK